jgi:hypothetical protein
MQIDNDSVAIVIPFYKTNLNKYELISVRQCLKVFNGRNIEILAPKRVSESDLRQLPLEWTDRTIFNLIDSSHLSSIRAYNRLLLDVSFYKLFERYKYILIYQFDAYAFRDELDYWIDKDYDYIGAPIYYYNQPYGREYLACVGVGGFSLRKVVSFTDVILQNKRIFYSSDLEECLKPFNIKGKIPRYYKYLTSLIRNKLRVSSGNNGLDRLGFSLNEDVVFGRYVPRYYKHFKVGDYVESVRFCIDAHAEQEMKILGKLPFGIHAWWTKTENLNYWTKFINVDQE